MNILSYAIALCVFMGILKIIALPFKLISKLLINSILGGIVLFILSYFGIGVILNWWTIVLTAVLGAPGVVIAVIITMIL